MLIPKAFISDLPIVQIEARSSVQSNAPGERRIFPISTDEMSINGSSAPAGTMKVHNIKSKLQIVNMRFGLITCLLFFLGQQAFSQKSTEVRDQLWLGYLNQTRFTHRSELWTDLHFRLTDHFIRQKNQLFLRFGYTYYLTDDVRLTVGYAYIYTYAQSGSPDFPEHRPWQQIQWIEKKKGFNLTQLLRIEQRYRRKIVTGELTDAYAFNWRFRYSIGFIFPLKGTTVAPKTPFLFFNEDLFVNAGKQIVSNYFDQNRIVVGLGYQFTRHYNVQLAYMDAFQQLPAGNKYLNINAVRLFVYHNIDLRKPKD